MYKVFFFSFSDANHQKVSYYIYTLLGIVGIIGKISRFRNCTFTHVILHAFESCQRRPGKVMNRSESGSLSFIDTIGILAVYIALIFNSTVFFYRE